MSEQTKEQNVTKEGIEVDEVTFDANGKVQGVEESDLDDVAGGLMVAKDNSGCINAWNC